MHGNSGSDAEPFDYAERQGSDVVSDDGFTPVTVRVRDGWVELYACDNYGNDPQGLAAEGARDVAASLLKAADELEADDA